MRPDLRILTIAALASSALLAAVPAAGAATRYAAPDSTVTTGTCAAESPGCRLDHAINNAGAADTVVVLSGDYTVTWPILATQVVHLEGKAGYPRPRILGDPALAAATVNLPKGGSARHLYLESKSAFSALSTKGVNVSNVIAYGQSSDGADAKAGSGSVIRDSVFHTGAGSPYSGLKLWDDEVTGPIDVVNVTAVGTGARSTGIANGSGGLVTIVNTIARGATNDILLTAGVQEAVVRYSNYRPLASTGVIAGSGNQSATPTFVDAAARDFHPAAGAPTIDSGTAGLALGPDPDGTSRGSSPDIGAYESFEGVVGPPGTTGTTGTTSGTDPAAGDDTADDSPSHGETGGASELPPAAPPAVGRSVGLGPVRGSITVRIPGTTRAVPLEAGASVPVGSIVDATEGVVVLTSARDRTGKPQTGQFWGGVFKVSQRRRGDTYTELKLAGKPPRCTGRSRVNAAARRWSRKRLWGRDRGGRFRTRGRQGSATVRGTEWLTEDRCTGTYFKVKNGSVVVRDRARRKNVTLRSGRGYLARRR